MTPRTLAALLLALTFAGPALAQGSGPQGAGTTSPNQQGTAGEEIVPGTAPQRNAPSRENRGTATPQGQLPTGAGTGKLVPGQDVTTGGSAAAPGR